MNRLQLHLKIGEIIEEMGLGPVTTMSHFINDLNFDSLDCVEFAMKIEDEFNIDITDEEAEKYVTMTDAVTIVHNKLLDKEIE